MQDCGAAFVAATTGDDVVPAYLTASILVQGSEKSEDAIAGLSFEAHGHAGKQVTGKQVTDRTITYIFMVRR